jgi:hypothetical protein
MSEGISYFGWAKQKIVDKPSDILLFPQKSQKKENFRGRPSIINLT